MTKVLDINLGQIRDIRDDCVSGGSVSSDLDELQTLISDTQGLIGLGSGHAYRKLEELLDEIDDNVRGIANNIEDLGNGCKKYFNKMSDLGKPVTSYDDNMSVSDDLGDVKKNYKASGYQSDLKDAKRIASTINDNVHLSLGDGLLVDHAKLKNFNSSVEAHCNSIKSAFDQVDGDLENVYDKLEDVEDFKSHEYNEAVNIGAKIVVGTAIAVATTAAAAALLPEAAAVAAVIATEAALTAAGTTLVSGAKHYYNGSSVKEAAGEGATDGIKAGITSAAIGGAVTSGLNKGSNIWKGIKGADDEITSTADAFLKKGGYTNSTLDGIESAGAETGKGKFGLSPSQKSYLVKEGVKDFGIKSGIEIGVSGAENKIDNVEYTISISELYEEMQQVLEDMGVELEGDDIWQNI